MECKYCEAPMRRDATNIEYDRREDVYVCDNCGAKYLAYCDMNGNTIPHLLTWMKGNKDKKQ